MTTTISVSDETKARFDDLRPAGAASNDEFLSALLEHYEDGVAPEYADGRVLSEDAVDEIIEELAAAVEPEQGYIDDDTVARAVAAKIDYAELARMTADELEERMR